MKQISSHVIGNSSQYNLWWEIGNIHLLRNMKGGADLSSQQAEAEGSQVQDQPGLQSRGEYYIYENHVKT
jgi:hypothetical protein